MMAEYMDEQQALEGIDTWIKRLRSLREITEDMTRNDIARAFLQELNDADCAKLGCIMGIVLDGGETLHFRFEMYVVKTQDDPLDPSQNGGADGYLH
jgi:hypothetical protein